MIRRSEVSGKHEKICSMATFQILQDGERCTVKGEKIRTRKRDVQHRALQPIDNRQNHNPKRVKIEISCDKIENVSQVNVKNSSLVRAAKIEVVKQEKNSKEEHHNLEKHLECLEIVNTQLKPLTKKESRKRQIVEDLEYNSEYLRDIWSYLINMEKKVNWPKANYMTKQVHLNNSMRSILVDWLVSVAEEYNLSEQTLHLSVNYIDRFLSQMSVVKDKFQLLGSAAMMLAGKVEDIYPPNSSEWAYLTGNTYSSEQVQRMEMLLLKVLKFDVQPPTMLAFIQHMCVEHKLDKETMYLAMYISELILLEGEDYLNYTPSKLAASAVVLSRMILSKKQPWPRTLESSCGYTLKQLSPVVQRQNRTFTDSPTTPQQAIQTKYQSTKYHKVALLQPKALDLDE